MTATLAASLIHAPPFTAARRGLSFLARLPAMAPAPATDARAPRHTARYFAYWLELLKARGVDTAGAMLRAGVDLGAPDATLSVAEHDALLRECARTSGREDLGLLLGREVKLSSHEILGFGILTSPTLDYAL